MFRSLFEINRGYLLFWLLILDTGILMAKDKVGVALVFDNQFKNVKEELTEKFQNEGLGKIYKSSKENFVLFTVDNSPGSRSIDGKEVKSYGEEEDWCSSGQRILNIISKFRNQEIILFIDDTRMAESKNVISNLKDQRDIQVVWIDRHSDEKDYLYKQFKNQMKSGAKEIQMIFWFPEDLKFKLNVAKPKLGKYVEGDQIQISMQIPKKMKRTLEKVYLQYPGGEEEIAFSLKTSTSEEFDEYRAEFKVKEGDQTICVKITSCGDSICQKIRGERCTVKPIEWFGDYKIIGDKGPYTLPNNVNTKDCGEYIVKQRNKMFQFVINKQCAFESYQIVYKAPYTSNPNQQHSIRLEKSIDEVDPEYDIYKIDKSYFDDTLFNQDGREDVIDFIILRSSDYSTVKAFPYRVILERCPSSSN